MLQTVTFNRLNEQNTEFAIEEYIAHDIKLKNKIKNLRYFKILFFYSGLFRILLGQEAGWKNR